MNIDVELKRLLLEIAFVGANSLQGDAAVKIGEALSLLEPKQEITYLATMFGHLSNGKNQEVIKIGKSDALPINPQNQLTHFALGMAYYFSQNKEEAIRHLKPIADNCDDEGMKEKAEEMLSKIEDMAESQ